MGWVANVTPWPLYPRERPGTHCVGGWVGPRAQYTLKYQLPGDEGRLNACALWITHIFHPWWSCSFTEFAAWREVLCCPYRKHYTVLTLFPWNYTRLLHRHQVAINFQRCDYLHTQESNHALYFDVLIMFVAVLLFELIVYSDATHLRCHLHIPVKWWNTLTDYVLN